MGAESSFVSESDAANAIHARRAKHTGLPPAVRERTLLAAGPEHAAR